jgi:hypothetical protein
MVTGATPPATLPAGDAIATTAADGSYTVRGFDATKHDYVMVLPATGDAHITLHEDANIAGGQIRTLYLTTLGSVTRDPLFNSPTNNELGLFNSLNSQRAAAGLPPLVADEALVEAARYWNMFSIVNSYFDECIPSCSTAHNPTPAMPAVGGVDLVRYQAFGGLAQPLHTIVGQFSGVDATSAAESLFSSYPSIYGQAASNWAGPGFEYAPNFNGGGDSTYFLVE